jgi:hypothetical protein
LAALSFPIVFAYVIPGLGTNWLGLWEFNTRLRIGHFRPHHGFVFGAATSFFALACLEPPSRDHGWWEAARAAVVLGSVLAFWNWLYDLLAIESGFLRVYNAAFAQGQGAAAIATMYAPILFGTFGACYGLALRTCEQAALYSEHSDALWWWVLAFQLSGLTAPVLAYVAVSFWRTGESGLRSYQGADHEGQI